MSTYAERPRAVLVPLRIENACLSACLKNLLPLILWRRGLGRGGPFLGARNYFGDSFVIFRHAISEDNKTLKRSNVENSRNREIWPDRYQSAHCKMQNCRGIRFPRAPGIKSQLGPVTPKI